MSDTTAFLAGSAVAGVAALLMLKSGGISLSQPELAQSYSPPAAIAPASPAGTVALPTQGDPATDRQVEALLRSQLDDNKSSTDQLKIQLEQQKFLTEQLKLQLEQQQQTTAQLKSQLDDQRQEATAVIDRLREQQRSMDMLTLQQALPKESEGKLIEQAKLLDSLQTQQNQGSTTQVVMLWTLGGILLVLIVGGGVILVSVIVILIQQQRKPPRPVPVIHQPITLPLPYTQMPPGGYRRSPLLLPPSVRRSPSAPNPNPAYNPAYNPYNPYNPYNSEGSPSGNLSSNLYREWDE